MTSFKKHFSLLLLSILGFGLIVGVISGLYYFYISLENFLLFDQEALAVQTSLLYSSVFKVIVLFSLISVSLILLSNFVALYLFLKRRKEFVPFFIFSSIVITFISFVNELLSNILEWTFYRFTLTSAVLTILWSFYLLKSNTVKETFVMGRVKYFKITEDQYELLKKNELVVTN